MTDDLSDQPELLERALDRRALLQREPVTQHEFMEHRCVFLAQAFLPYRPCGLCESAGLDICEFCENINSEKGATDDG